MPLYEYQCTKCKHTFEKIQKFSDPPVTECPKCGGKVEQLLSAPAIQFKGAGWYVTDYAKKSGSPGSEKSGSDISSSSESKSETKSDSKSETKSESKPSGSDKK
ncbi:MAG: FmdB family zinc ribbon protein [Terriglobales bacterium]